MNELIIVGPQKWVGQKVPPMGMHTKDQTGFHRLDGEKMNVPNENVKSWHGEFIRICCEHGVRRQKDIVLLKEAYRRRMMFQPAKPLGNAWLGLGTISEYRSQMFETVDGKRLPRTVQWWKLSYKGLMVLSDIIGQMPFPESNDAKIKLNNILYGIA